jgi:YidC/Oxa1 family membrane protein insertase
MDQDKRVMIAFALSFGMLVLWRIFFMKEPPPPPKAPPAPVTQSAKNLPEAPTAPAVEKSSTPVKLPVLHAAKAEEIVVENDFYRLTFSTQGAVVRSWVLKKYRDAQEKALDVVNAPACEKLGWPMSLDLANDELKGELNAALYVAKPAGRTVTAPATIEFTYSDGKVQATKRFTFGSSYEIRAEASVFDGQHHLPVGVEWPGGFGDNSLPQTTVDSASQAVYGLPGDISTLRLSKVKEDRSLPGPMQLSGLEDQYFGCIFLMDFPDQFFRIGRRVWTPDDWKGKDSDKPNPFLVVLASPQPKPLAFRLYVAPKDLDVLRAANPSLEGLVDYGWFSFVAKPLFLGLRYIYGHWVANYGWAIVILTVIINIAMFPLKLKSIRSAQEMQRVAPLVKSIQEKYKGLKMNDPRKQRQNQEMMKLYQEHGINPLGGCLPMVLQMPFLYGF